jgi:hypothetical protein
LSPGTEAYQAAKSWLCCAPTPAAAPFGPLSFFEVITRGEQDRSGQHKKHTGTLGRRRGEEMGSTRNVKMICVFMYVCMCISI